jgi:hypothetical protein
MSVLSSAIIDLIASGDRRFSAHAVRELVNDGILVGPLLETIETSIIVEEYPGYHKGPCVLFLQRDETGRPVHLLWGLPSGQSRPAVLITAYRPEESQWDTSFTRRRAK